MRILMIGRGTIAATYGWALATAGHEVTYYVRPGRAEQYGDTLSLDVTDLRRGLRGRRMLEQLPVRYLEQLTPELELDLIVLAVSHHRLADAADLLAAHTRGATVLVLSNLWPNLSVVTDRLPAERVLFGFPGAGGGFDANGTLRALLMKSVRIGVDPNAPTDRFEPVRELFRGAGFRVIPEPDMAGWLAIHFIGNAGVHAQGLRLGTLSQLPGNTAAMRDALQTAGELLPVVEALGYNIDRHRGSTFPFRHPRMLGPLFAWITAHVPAAGLAMSAYTDPNAEEPRAICRDALSEARRFGVSVPTLERLATHT